jgi:hypothetical protein
VRQLEASLESSSGLELDRAIAEHRSLRAASVRRRRRVLEEMDPRGEIIARRLGRRGRSFTGDDAAPLAGGRPRWPVSAPA